MKLNENRVYLYDEIGNRFERKDVYLKELYTLKEAAKKDPSKKAQYRAHLKQKKTHPYRVSLKAFEKAETDFLKTLNGQRSAFMQKLDHVLPKRLKALKWQYHMSVQKTAFYKKYTELCYAAELAYERSVVINDQLPEIIENYEAAFKAYLEAKEAYRHIDAQKQATTQQAYDAFKVAQNEAFEVSKAHILKQKRNGQISSKALKQGIEELKIQKKEMLKVKSYEIEKNALREEVRNLKYQLTKGIDKQLKVLKSNCSDIRRRLPIETAQQTHWHAYAGVLIPGVGQLLNKQYFKALFFLLATVFIYAVAWPYALGYGNYQGDGVMGLFTLAEGGLRIEKSLIFMIEGIIAIFLMVFALGLYMVSFLDVKRVEAKMIQGIRPKDKFELLLSLETEGFPYMVSLPALILTVFVVLVPITTAILLSFTGMDPQNQSKFPWVGFDNYALLIKGEGLAGSVFYSILIWTVIWTVFATTLAILLGFFLALMVNNNRIKGKTFFRAVYLLPWAVPAFITIMFFSIMLSPDGVLTALLESITGAKILVKNSTLYSRITLILIQAWLGSSYVFLLSTGVLQAIPEDLYEAAQIDGATAWQRLRRITLPIVLFQTAPLLVGQYTFNFNNFSIIFLFNTGGPFNPTKYGNLAGSTDLLISYIFKLTTINQYQAIGAAITIVISMGLMLFAFIGFKNSKAFKEERL